ncbi:hypothetical protein [Celerinatantimonas diazotrophica]|uniref:Uncharacterized protein n=1 Tax=Celerinatantimonas diazotrophica TaxID=412034 RepID=A0A4R1JLT7_9GAMM|nr:hypothetical protein [Celerinatantimonas diazotrophica]TCK52035.1 hypothetical protein EV690_2135 [Celerinatantimonas diazotrophica]CAG9296262.1 hypothetical protein CEDIAZO_01410 [Celerinatantimonas diazotrophica]
MKRTFVNRRKGPDRFQRLLGALSVLCWVLFLVALIVFHYARPQVNYGYLDYKGIATRQHWDAAYLPWFIRSLWLCFGITIVEVLLRIKRNRRKNDYHYYNIFILMLMVIGALGSYYVGLFT